MIQAIGTDIIEIDRISRLMARGPRYLHRIFSPRELELARSRGETEFFFAGRFAAKEAVAKCLGPPLGWQDVEILAAEDGKPLVALKGRAAVAAGSARVHLTISHCQSYAVAFAVLEGDL